MVMDVDDSADADLAQVVEAEAAEEVPAPGDGVAGDGVAEAGAVAPPDVGAAAANGAPTGDDLIRAGEVGGIPVDQVDARPPASAEVAVNSAPGELGTASIDVSVLDGADDDARPVRAADQPVADDSATAAIAGKQAGKQAVEPAAGTATSDASAESATAETATAMTTAETAIAEPATDPAATVEPAAAAEPATEAATEPAATTEPSTEQPSTEQPAAAESATEPPSTEPAATTEPAVAEPVVQEAAHPPMRPRPSLGHDDFDHELTADDVRSWVRPYVWTGGRTHTTLEFALETLVSARGAADDEAMRDEHRKVLELCEKPRSVSEIAALLSVPLHVAKTLLGAMAEEDMLVVHGGGKSKAGPDLALMERVLRGLRNLE